jgi:hypothetical protein
MLRLRTFAACICFVPQLAYIAVLCYAFTFEVDNVALMFQNSFYRTLGCCEIEYP